MSILDRFFNRTPAAVATPPPSNKVIRGILAEYADELAEERGRSRGLWIFRPSVDHEHYARRIDAVIDDASLKAASSAIAGDAESWSCSCRCRLHMRAQCPKCLRVERCPVHTEADPASLRPAILEDPETLARAVHELYIESITEYEPQTWEQLPQWHRAALVEAYRQVITSRVPR